MVILVEYYLNPVKNENKLDKKYLIVNLYLLCIVQ